ncbi:MAG: AbrB family transcriptional regulator [Pseudomonadota bacterium]
MRVAKWGNSLAVRLSTSVVEALALQAGDYIDIHVLGKRHFGVAKSSDIEAAVNRLRAYGALVPADFKFDRDEANSR